MEESLTNHKKFASGAGKQTLLKTTLRNQINLISVTDQKSNMLLSINAIIISIVVTLMGAKLVINLNEHLSGTPISIPIVLLLITCLFSGVLCIYAATPKSKHTELESDLGILLMTTKKQFTDPKTYMDEMFKILASNELIYKNLILDIHNLGMLLTKKYKLLRYAYYSFFVGITSSVLLFIVMIFA